MDHGLGDIDALFVVANEASPFCEPAEGALHHPATRHDLEARLVVEAADNLDDKVEEGGLVHGLPAVIGAIGEQVLNHPDGRVPRPPTPQEKDGRRTTRRTQPGFRPNVATFLDSDAPSKEEGPTKLCSPGKRLRTALNRASNSR